jgi:hypothetical protein
MNKSISIWVQNSFSHSCCYYFFFLIKITHELNYIWKPVIVKLKTQVLKLAMNLWMWFPPYIFTHPILLESDWRYFRFHSLKFFHYLNASNDFKSAIEVLFNCLFRAKILNKANCSSSFNNWILFNNFVIFLLS